MTKQKIALLTGATRASAGQLAELGMTVLVGAKVRGAARRPRGPGRAGAHPRRHRPSHRWGAEKHIAMSTLTVLGTWSCAYLGVDLAGAGDARVVDQEVEPAVADAWAVLRETNQAR